MAKTEYTIWSCDVCGKEYRGDKYPKELKKMDVACKDYDCEGRTFTYGSSGVDLCPECLARLFRATSEHFAIVEATPGGRRIRRVDHGTEQR